MAEEPSIETLVAAYIKIREKLAEVEAEHRAKTKDMKEQQEMITNHLLDKCKEMGLSSIKTAAGTVSRKTQTRFWTSDWDSMYQFLKENDALFLLDKRINTLNMKQFLEDNPDLLPMGLNIDSTYAVTVYKPRKY